MSLTSQSVGAKTLLFGGPAATDPAIDTPLPQTLELAFVNWFDVFLLGANSSNCTHVMRNNYSPGASAWAPQEDGTLGPPTTPGSTIVQGVCAMFTSVAHDLTASVQVSCCPGVDGAVYCKGSLPPFLNATGNVLGMPPQVLETVWRFFNMKGYLTPEGKFVADEIIGPGFGPGTIPDAIVPWGNEWTC